MHYSTKPFYIGNQWRNSSTEVRLCIGSAARSSMYSDDGRDRQIPKREETKNDPLQVLAESMGDFFATAGDCCRPNECCTRPQAQGRLIGLAIIQERSQRKTSDLR